MEGKFSSAEDKRTSSPALLSSLSSISGPQPEKYLSLVSMCEDYYEDLWQTARRKVERKHR